MNVDAPSRAQRPRRWGGARSWRRACGALGLLSLLPTVGCAGIVGRPDPRDWWDDDVAALTSAAPWPWAVALAQDDGLLTVSVGSGAIVHSSERGTYALTAAHVVEGGPTIRVWLYDWSGDLPRDGVLHEKRELRCYLADVVHPAPESADDLTIFPLDFGVVRLRAAGRFPCLDVHAGPEEELPPGTPVELVAIHPEEHPHAHPFSWTDWWTEDTLQEGHSGGPILHQGRLFAVASAAWADTLLVFPGGRPTVTEMRRALAEAGLGFVLGGQQQ